MKLARCIILFVISLWVSQSLAKAQWVDNDWVYNNRNDRFLYFESVTEFWYYDEYSNFNVRYGNASGEVTPGTNEAKYVKWMAEDDAFGTDYHMLVSSYTTVTYYEYYTVEVVSPTSANAIAYVGVPWTPSFSGGWGVATQMWHVPYYTNWSTNATTWTPPAPGVYAFHVGALPKSGWHTNATDPIVGPIDVNYTIYYVTVY